MARPISKGMKKALAAIMHEEESKRLSATAAAKKYKVKRESIYHSATYLKWAKAQREKAEGVQQ